MNNLPYKTLIQYGESEFVINKSRFIGCAAPVADEAAAISFLAAVRKRHPQATHNCYAYILGRNMGIMRYSDDGEPGGTAGQPILEVMKARKVVDAVVVVTRYFGGVLLGAGGLVRAYAQGAASAIDASAVGAMYPTARYMAQIPYPLLNRVDFFLKSAPVTVEDRTFTETVTLTFLVKTQDEQSVCAKIADITEGVCVPVRFDEFYHPWGAEP